ncbi:MAG: hypothetical protein GX154_05915 [Clostridiales bacterium]|nr:hypothetical protein [Clostridiales bacterium]
MIRKIKEKYLQIMSYAMMIVLTNPILARAAVTPVEAESFNTKLLDIASKYLTPLGGTIILFAVVFGGIKLLMSAYSPEKRKETMGGLGYVVVGAILVGGAMFFAGVFLGLGQSFK